MRVLVISDTHLTAKGDKLPAIIKQEAKACDCCLHSGDFSTYSVFEALSSWTKVYGVCGNMDDGSVRAKLPRKQIIGLEEVKVGLIHGAGHPSRLIDYLKKEFAKDADGVDIFVFGHSHCPLDEIKDGKIYFNPGSATDTVFAPYRSYGILDISGKDIKRRIVKIG